MFSLQQNGSHMGSAAAAKSLQSCSTMCDPLNATQQVPPALGLSRQEYWSGFPFPSPMHEVKSEGEVTQLCPTLSDPMDCSLPDSSIHGIFQPRVLEWVAVDLELDKDGFRFWPHTQTLTLDKLRSLSELLFFHQYSRG